MKGKPHTVFQMAILDPHVVGDAPDDAVAVEVARRDLAHRDAITLIQANAAIVKRPPVDHFIMGLVAIDGDVFDAAGDATGERLKTRATPEFSSIKAFVNFKF